MRWRGWMFSELLVLGKRLEAEGKLPPPGFYFYKEPIKWVIHFDPDKPEQSSIRLTEINTLPRPYSGRASGTLAYPLADEAAYVLGINRGKGSGKDTAKKHTNFVHLLDKIVAKSASDNPALSRITAGIKYLIESKQLESLPKWREIESKDWVSVQVEDQNGNGKQLIDHPTILEFWIGELAKTYGPADKDRNDKQLIEHPAIGAFWIGELAERCVPGEKDRKDDIRLVGECGISGKKESSLVGRIPLSVTLYKPVPLHSLNADAFVSGMEGTSVFKKCHVGQGIEAGDLVARTLNYLRRQSLHHKILAKAIEAGKLNTDSPQNLFAFYWIEQPDAAKPVMSVSAEDVLAKLSLLFSEGAGEGEEEGAKEEEKGEIKSKSKTKTKPSGELSQLDALLNSPWTGQEQALRLDENVFCLLMLSPNKGRISVREWFKVGLGQLKNNLKAYLDAQRIEAPDGGARRSFAIQDMLRALEESNISLPEYKQPNELASPNLTRALLRCAYLGEVPPTGLLEPAVTCFRHSKVLKRYEQKSDRERFALLQHQLAAVMKLILTHSQLEVRMNENDQVALETRSPAFLSGRLLAVLEEAQLAAMNWKINTTLIDQFYSTAATAPYSVLGMLISRITSQHMPKLRKNMRWKYDKLERLLETIQTEMDSRGGFPKTLTLKQQAEFSLGFYTQRAAFTRERPPRNTQPPTEQLETRQGAIA